MTQLVDRVIAAIRLNHDTLVTLIPNLEEDLLASPSGASEWTIAQVLSHLGSGAEIGRKPIARAAGEDVADEGNDSIWARWDAASPIDQTAAFVQHDSAYLATVEGLDEQQRASITVDLGFLPEPVPLVVALGMRLNELANHAWDVRVGLDPSAEIDDESAELLIELSRGPLAFLLGFSGKAAELDEEARVAVPGATIRVADEVAVLPAASDPTATLTGPKGAVVRLLSGRLKDPYAEGVSVEGNVGLDDLRRVFPGY
ncbi:MULTISPECIES: maleylpyruvate isomerase family mycothiol-dependent enzyme [unclassified Nocardioides]|uniref:maleylpyruvate isomerase family mycothiol-dependent enzyme n=1 Tax=unclassified Nocardioides TaxID=2615069 RepID=UPI00362139BA